MANRIRVLNQRAKKKVRSSFAYFRNHCEKHGKEPYGYAWRRATAHLKTRRNYQ